MNRLLLITVCCVLGLAASWPAGAVAAPFDDALKLLASESHTEMTQGIEALGNSSADAALAVLTSLEAGTLKKDGSGTLYIEQEGSYVLAATLAPAEPAGPVVSLGLNNTSRRALAGSAAKLRLTARDLSVRRVAAKQLAEYPDATAIELIRGLIAQEKDRETQASMALALAKVDITSPEPGTRIRAARTIADSSDISMEGELKRLVGSQETGAPAERDPAVHKEMRSALQSVQGRVFWSNTVANTIYGLSLGSVLVLAALGLAITFGLMRVINMAHGELLMLGAYSTYFVREKLLGISEAAAEYYLWLAIPFAFLVTFCVGVVLERSVIRHLYGRPLETLLATWGLSLVLIQCVRLTFGAQNVAVANPAFLSGGFDLLPGLVVPYSRIAVLCFTALVVFFIGFVLRGTSVGLKVRAVTQNREIAASLGIATHRIDMWTFGLGSGLAGLGGVALSQLGNVGPELGQQHIIDSFMVVVLGGVGNILGTVLAGVGLGIANKLLEPSVGAVLGKIMLLGLLILFIQWRPQGLFALKGRAAEG